jgi:hypothetical protein
MSLIYSHLPLTAICLVKSSIPPEPSSSQPKTFQLRPELIQSTFPPLGGSNPISKSPSTFLALQMNLCNSGWAKCYQGGQSIIFGSAIIKQAFPRIVTVNEICSNDVTQHLQPALAEVWPQDWIYSVFMPAIFKGNDSAYHCTNGDLYGSAVIGHVPAASWNGVKTYGGKYTVQWGSSNEERIFACADTGDLFACTTHLAADSDPDVEKTALTQCQALMFDAVPYLQGLSGVSGKTVVGGDFNLEYDTGDAENVQKCVPAGYTRKGDGDVQHFVVSDDFAFRGVREVHVDFTDHNALIADLAV